MSEAAKNGQWSKFGFLNFLGINNNYYFKIRLLHKLR
jgi:hypothetical protein